MVIGGNDWAAAWAVDPSGVPMFPVGRGFAGERQREIAGLLDRARRHEAKGELEPGIALLDQALQLAPGERLMQRRRRLPAQPPPQLGDPFR